MKLSVIVPCYNSGKYLDRLLTSLTKQTFKDFEVVLADDCSTEPYDDVVEKYTDRLNIVRTKTAYNCCPGNTRQAGADVAQGEWITFADHDDEFTTNALPRVIKGIKDFKKKQGFDVNVVYTKFDEIHPVTGKVLREHSYMSGWTHGKFYRRSWWDKHHLRYKKDLRSHEDIYMSSRVTCALNEDNEQPMYLPFTSYHWVCHAESQSRVIHEHTFIEEHFDDYISATGRAYMDYVLDGGEADFAVFHCCCVVMYCYFYLMGFMFHNPSGYIKENAGIAGEYISEVKQLFGLDNVSIMQYCAMDNGKYFWSTMQTAALAVGGYIPCMTLQEFLEILTPKEGADYESPPA